MKLLQNKLTSLNYISLYIHIPFCREKCSYCDFYSEKLSSDSETEVVLKRILDDTENILNKIGNPEIRTLFIGGGTPSSVPLNLLEEFLSKLFDIIKSKPDESTIEINPETINRELLETLSGNGIERLSIGVQSLKDRILDTLGRNTDVITTRKGLETVKNNWNGGLSIDLINTVPGQSLGSALSDITEINKFNPDHISLYNLTFEKSTKLYTMLKSGKIEELSESTDRIMQRESFRLLESLGYRHYEISNFAKKGKESLHNINYWKMGPYLGTGPSAASTLMTVKGPVRIVYRRSISDFIETSSIDKRTDFEYLEPDSFFLEHLMMGFRLIDGVQTNRIENVFNIDLKKYMEPMLNKWGGNLIFKKDSIRLTEKGLSLLNPFLVDIASLIDRNSSGRYRDKINWPPESSQS